MTQFENRCQCGARFQDLADLKRHKWHDCDEPYLGEAWNMPKVVTGP